MGEDYRIENITMEKIKEACHTMSVSFIQLSGIYKRQDSTYEEIYPVFYYQLEHSIKNSLSYALYLKDKMVGVGINHDMFDYPKLKNTAWLQGQSKLISYERKYVQQIEDQLLKSNYQRGVAVYCIYGSVLPEYASKGIGLLLVSKVIYQLKKRGFKTYFGTASSHNVFKIFQSIGVTVIRQINCEGSGMEKDKYSLCQLDLAKSIPTKDMLKKAEIKSKL